MVDSVAVELGKALTGEDLPLGATDLDSLAKELADFGWDRDRLCQLRAERQLSGLAWPFEVNREVVAKVGFAVFHARLQQLRKQLGLTGLQPRNLALRPFNDDERRLQADRPPHWG